MTATKQALVDMVANRGTLRDMNTVTRSYKSTAITGPDEAWVSLVIDGETDMTIDLTSSSAVLLELGMTLEDQSAEGKAVAQLEVHDQLTFLRNGSTVDPTVAADAIGKAVILAVVNAAQAR